MRCLPCWRANSKKARNTRTRCSNRIQVCGKPGFLLQWKNSLAETSTVRRARTRAWLKPVRAASPLRTLVSPISRCIQATSNKQWSCSRQGSRVTQLAAIDAFWAENTLRSRKHVYAWDTRKPRTLRYCRAWPYNRAMASLFRLLYYT